jgi:hypothetical protein
MEHVQHLCVQHLGASHMYMIQLMTLFVIIFKLLQGFHLIILVKMFSKSNIYISQTS